MEMWRGDCSLGFQSDQNDHAKIAQGQGLRSREKKDDFKYKKMDDKVGGVFLAPTIDEGC
jgi:hypothetical protein